MTPDIRTRLQPIFDAHTEAFAALRAANRHIESVNRSFSEMVQTHDAAIQAALAANQAALDLLDSLDA